MLSLSLIAHLRPIQVRLGPTELHHPECYLDVLWLRQFFNLGFIQTCVEDHRGVVHCLLIINTEELPALKDLC